LSELKQNGWLEMKLDPNDARKRVYKLKSPDHAIEEMEKDEENNNRRL
jgi:type I restriction enzyme M protein